MRNPFGKGEKEQNLLFRIIEYTRSKNIVAKKTLFSDLSLTDEEQKYFDSVLVTNDISKIGPNHVLVFYSNSDSTNHLDFQYMLTPTALYQYIDYLEIVEARKNSRNAFVISLIAIFISVALTFIQIFYSKC